MSVGAKSRMWTLKVMRSLPKRKNLKELTIMWLWWGKASWPKWLFRRWAEFWRGRSQKFEKIPFGLQKNQLSNKSFRFRRLSRTLILGRRRKHLSLDREKLKFARRTSLTLGRRGLSLDTQIFSWYRRRSLSCSLNFCNCSLDKINLGLDRKSLRCDRRRSHTMER